MTGRGANAQFRFGSRKPGSTTPLLFELAEKHLKDCKRMYVSSFASYDLTEDYNHDEYNTHTSRIPVMLYIIKLKQTRFL